MPVNLTRQMPYTIHIDAEPVRLHFKRMAVEEAEIFKAQFDAYNGDRGKPDEVMGSQTDLTPEYRAWLKANMDWLRDLFARYVTVQAGDLTIDGDTITGGLDLFDALGSHLALRAEILANLYYAQILTEAAKKNLLSRLASAIGSSTAPLPAANGETPGPAVAIVAPAGSVAREAVMRPSSASSGTTAPLSSEPALSGSLT